jgi:hypothetical protein
MERSVRRCVKDERDARELLARWEDSGERLGLWAHQNGLSRQSLQWWRARVEGARGAATTIRLAEVVLPRESPAEEAVYRVRMANGREVVVDRRFNSDVLGRLLDVVDS